MDKDGEHYATGPSEFLYLIENSEAVFTDSFHSCVFSIIFNKPFLSTDEYLTERGNELKSYQKIWDTIHRGSMPKLIDRSINWEWFYRDYIKTYLERDVRQIINIRDLNNFKNFMAVLPIRKT